MRSDIHMDEAERRFQECLERFSAELGDLVMRHVDEQVSGALAEAAEERSLEVQLRLEDLRPEKKAPAVARVDPDSMLGGELNKMTSLETTIQNELESAMTPAPPKEPAAPPRPLFVHRRARDGRIHELSRAADPLPASG